MITIILWEPCTGPWWKQLQASNYWWISTRDPREKLIWKWFASSLAALFCIINGPAGSLNHHRWVCWNSWVKYLRARGRAKTFNEARAAPTLSIASGFGMPFFDVRTSKQRKMHFTMNFPESHVNVPTKNDKEKFTVQYRLKKVQDYARVPSKPGLSAEVFAASVWTSKVFGHATLGRATWPDPCHPGCWNFPGSQFHAFTVGQFYLDTISTYYRN